MEAYQDRDLFDLGVQITICEWEALNAAIENGMGGHDAQIKLDWMADVIASYFRSNKNDFDALDAELYVEEILNNEFDTIIEDDSTKSLIQRLYKYFVLADSQKFDELRAFLMPKVSIVNKQQTRLQNAREQRRLAKQMRDVEMDGEEISSDSEDEGNEQANEQEKQKLAEPMQEDDGWTQIKRRH